MRKNEPKAHFVWVRGALMDSGLMGGAG